jgi:hypothetical protein
MQPQQLETSQSANRQKPGERVILSGAFALFAALLALLLHKHEMFGDEAQVWLIARHSRSLLELVSHLRYEGHPALWYLLVAIPAHLYGTFVWLKIFNYVFALLFAGMVLTETRLPVDIRILSLFSFFVFFEMGVISRSYMLAAVLLLAATRCLLAEKPRHYLAMVLLALAINTHFFAIPVAAAVFLWFYCLDSDRISASALSRLKEVRFWRSVGIMVWALFFCYLTLRPAADSFNSDYSINGLGWFGYLGVSIGQFWSQFVALVPLLLSDRVRQLLVPADQVSALAMLLSLILLVLLVAAQRTRQARWFLSTGLAFWFLAAVSTVHRPLVHHFNLVFVLILLALIASGRGEGNRVWLTPGWSRAIIMTVLWMQFVICLQFSVLQMFNPFSTSEQAAKWLMKSGLTNRPLIVAPDYAASVVLASTGIRTAYFPTCRCEGEFVVYRQGRDAKRQVTPEEYEALAAKYGVKPIVATHWLLSDESMKRMGVKLLYSPAKAFYWPWEDLWVYGDKGLNLPG